MEHWCDKCGKYTEQEIIEFHYDKYRDLGDGSLSDRRTIECTECKGRIVRDFAPDKR